MAITRPTWLVEPRVDGSPGILTGDGAPVAEMYDLGTRYVRRDAVDEYISDGAGTWTQILDSASSVTDHPATACTGSAVADHGASTSTTPSAADTDSGTASITVGGTTDSGTASITIGGTTASNGTGVTGSASTGVSVSPQAEIRVWSNPAAAGTNVLAQKNADFDETTWTNLTQPDVPEGRSIQVVFAGWNGGAIRIEGIRCDKGDDDFVEISGPGEAPWSATVTSDKAFVLVRRVCNMGTRTAGTVDVQWGPGLGIVVTGKTPTLLEAYETSAGGRDTGATLSGFGIFSPTVAPDGSKDYTITFVLSNTVTDSGHTHTGPSHTHGSTGLTATDAGHTHGSTGLTAADAGHTHGPGLHTHDTTPPSHVVTQPDTPILTHTITP